MADGIAPGAQAIIEAPAVDDTDELLEDELLVEDVSIDGMCGVY